MRTLEIAGASLLLLTGLFADPGWSQVGGGAKPSGTPVGGAGGRPVGGGGGGGGGARPCCPSGAGGGARPSVPRYNGPGDAFPSGPSRPGGPSTPGPSAPGPAGPSGPTPYTGPSTPFPPPGHPFSPFSTGERQDSLSWQVWWALNEDGLLDLRREIAATRAVSGSSDFVLGDGQRIGGDRSLRPTIDVLNDAVLPAVFLAVLTGGPVDLVCSEAIAVGRIGDPRTDTTQQPPGPTLRNMLSNPVGDVRECAALGLGILALDDHYEELRMLLEGEEAGAELVDRDEVADRTRAYAAYALGLLGRDTEVEYRREEIAELLVEVIDNEKDAPQVDVAVAATIALGMFQLEVGPPCGCLGADHAPQSSRQAMVHYLYRVYIDDKECDPLVRAHAATSMARAGNDAVPQELREAVVAELIDALANRSRERNEVKQSAVIALGRLGDCDDDDLDREIRNVLMRVSRQGGPQARRFALLAMAECAGRPGKGKGEPFAGMPIVRATLLKKLSTGKSGLENWSAIALGLLGRSLQENGVALSEDVDRALRAKLARARQTEKLGALAVAVALRRDVKAGKLLLSKLESTKEAGARGYAALALGQVREQDAIEKLGELLENKSTDANTLRRVAGALALLGDRRVAGELVIRLDEEGLSDEGSAAIAHALGVVGDASSVEALSLLMNKPDMDVRTRTFAVSSLGAIADASATPWYAQLASGLNYAATTETLANPAGTGVLNRR